MDKATTAIAEKQYGTAAMLITEARCLPGMCYNSNLLSQWGSIPTSYRSGCISIWKAAQFRKGHGQDVRGLSICNDTQHTLVSICDSEVILWNSVTNDVSKKIACSRLCTAISCITPLVYSDIIAIGTVDHFIIIWNVQTSKVIQTLVGHKGEVVSIKSSRGGDRIYSAASDGCVCIWDTAYGCLTTELKRSAIDCFCNCIDISTNGNMLATGWTDGSVVLWDVQSEAIVNTYRKHEGSITTLAMANGLIVTAG